MKKYFVTVLLLATSFSFVSSQVVSTVSTLTDDIDTTEQVECTTITYNLSLGSKDSKTKGQVTLLQAFLSQTGYLESDPTGYFGQATRSAVKKFQQANGISALGGVGAYTRAKIKSISCSASTVVSTPKAAVVIPTTYAPTEVKVLNASGFAAYSVSPNTASVKIGSFTLTSDKGAYLNNIEVFIGVSGYNISNITNLTIKSNGVVVGTPVGNASEATVFSFPALVIEKGAMKTFDVYADLGSGTGAVSIKASFSGTTGAGSSFSVLNDKFIPITTTGASSLADPVLTSSSLKSQYVVGGSTFGIAVFRLATNGYGTQATVTELRLKTTSSDAIESVTVNGVTAPMTSFGATISGISIPITSQGVDVPVTVKFAGFQNSTTGGSLTTGVSDVSLSLNNVVAKPASGNTIESKVSVSSNSHTLVASKPVVTFSSMIGGSLTLGAENKIGEFTVVADANGKIAVSSAHVSLSSSGISGITYVAPRLAIGNTTLSGSSVVISNGGALVNFTSPYEIFAGQSVTFSLFATVTGTVQSTDMAYVSSKLTSPESFVWKDTIGGNITLTGEKLSNFPLSSLVIKLVATTTPQKGSYRMYFNGSKTATTATDNITKEEALSNCKTNSSNNPKDTTMCTWNGVEIYSFTPVTQTSSVPTVEITSAPVLYSQYYTQIKEPVLIGKMKVKITAGSEAITFHKNDVSNLIPFSNGSGFAGANSNTYTLEDDRWDSKINIPANSSEIFSIRNTMRTAEIFQGVYFLKPHLFYFSYLNSGNNAQLEPSSFKNLASSNSITVVGETSPYITGITFTQVAGGIMEGSSAIGSIQGSRFDPTNNKLTINGITKLAVAPNKSIIFSPKDFNITTSGTYNVQVSVNGQASNNFGVYIAAAAATTVLPTVEFVSAPTLKLQYDSQNKESELIGQAKIKVTTGSFPISLHQSSIPGMLRFKAGDDEVSSNGMNFNAVSSLAGGTTIPANTSVTFDITNKAKTGTLFAGSYSLGLNGFNYIANGAYQDIQYTTFKNASGSNSVTIIGETSPYITGSQVSQKDPSTYYIFGKRFSPTANAVTINGITKSLPTDISGGILFSAKDFNLTTSGTYNVQVSVNAQASNNFGVNISAPVATIVAPTVEFVSAPTLKLQYDSAKRESQLVGQAVIKITTGASSIKLPAYASAVQVYGLMKSGTNTFVNLNSANTVSSSSPYSNGDIPANTSVTFTTTYTAKPSDMLPGAYNLSPTEMPYYDQNNNFKTVPVSSYKNLSYFMGNSVTVVGENAIAATITAFGNKDPNPTTGVTMILWNTSKLANVALDMVCTSSSINFTTTKGNSPTCIKGGVWTWSGQSSDSISIYPSGNTSPVTVKFTLTVLDQNGVYTSQKQSMDITFPATVIENYGSEGPGYDYNGGGDGGSGGGGASLIIKNSLSQVSKTILNAGQVAVSALSGATQASAAECVSITRNIHRGDESSTTKKLQEFLISKGLLSERATGFFGDLTIEAVKAYQRSLGVKETGMVYDVTRQAIMTETCQ